jgi:hypothetical protein
MEKFKRFLKTKIALLLAAVAVFSGGGLVMAPSANAYTSYPQNYVYRCIGPDYWLMQYYWIDYSWWEEVSYPWPKDHYELRPVALRSHNAAICTGSTYA